MAFYVLFMLFLDLLSTFEAAEVLPSAAYFPEPLPGDFSGVPTAPVGCFVVSSSITCNDISKTVFTDGAVGDESGSLMPTSFHAWSDSSGFSLSHGTATVRQVKLFFYHEPSMGIGLPQFTLSASSSNIIPGSPSLDYTLLGSQDLSEDDATVRNVILALTTTQSNEHFHIQFSLTNEIQQFAVSEVELCSDEGTECSTPSVATFSGNTLGSGCFVGSSGAVCSSISDTMSANGGDGEVEKDSSLAIGVSVIGIVVVVVVVELVIIIGMTVVIRKTCKVTKESKPSKEVLVYDYVTYQPPAAPEQIQLEENIAYETTHPQVEVSAPNVQPNIAYGAVLH